MQKSLRAAAAVLQKHRIAAYVSRVAWLDLERYVRQCHSECVSLDAADELGRLYVTSNSHYSPFNNSDYQPWHKINQIQVFTGWRQLNVSRAASGGDGTTRAEVLAERGATLWYSQGATGEVMVFIAPYKSDAMSVQEENFIIGKYRSAADISNAAIKSHFAKFFRYCSLCSVHGNLGFSGYSYRMWLKYNDLRHTNKMRANFIQNGVILALLGVWATFYTSSKWPW